MPLSGRYRAVIFDMDGLLLDTETLWHQAEAELFARHGAEFTHEDQLRVIGTNFEVTARYFAERLGWPFERRAELVEESTALMHDRVRDQVDARPGAVELIEGIRKLEGIRIGLASNSPRYLVDDALATAGLADAFDTIVTSDDVEHAKPAPDIYLLACRRLGVDPSDGACARGLGVRCHRRQGGRPDLHRCADVRRDRRLCRGSRRRLARATAAGLAIGPNAYPLRMCRSIKTLRTGAVPATDDEISAAALQYVRKVSGYRKPSTANERAFDEAVLAVAAASKQLLDAVAATHPQARRTA